MVLTQRSNGEKTVAFVERQESGIRNPKCGIRNPFKCHLLEHIVYFFISRSSIRITVIISSLTLQDIKQNVLETLTDQGINKPLSSFLLLFKQIGCQNSKQLCIVPFFSF